LSGQTVCWFVMQGKTRIAPLRCLAHGAGTQPLKHPSGMEGHTNQSESPCTRYRITTNLASTPLLPLGGSALRWENKPLHESTQEYTYPDGEKATHSSNRCARLVAVLRGRSVRDVGRANTHVERAISSVAVSTLPLGVYRCIVDTRAREGGSAQLDTGGLGGGTARVFQMHGQPVQRDGRVRRRQPQCHFGHWLLCRCTQPPPAANERHIVTKWLNAATYKSTRARRVGGG
jgi:hypothetical protein